MTDIEKLALCKERLGIVDYASDSLLEGYIRDAGYFILSVTGQAEVPNILTGAQVGLSLCCMGQEAQRAKAHTVRAVYP